MTALAFELSSRYIQPLLDLAADRDVALDGLLAEWAVEAAQLREGANWVSLRFCEALCEHLAERLGAAALEERIVQEWLSPRGGMGFMYALMRSFGSPQVAYPRLPHVLRELNRIDEIRVARRGGTEALVEYRPSRPEWVERSPLICRLRRAQLAAGPTLWGLPPASVEELECQTRGAGRCLYRVRWARRTGVWGTALGTAAALVLGLALGGGAPVVAPVVLAGGAFGWAFDQRRRLAELRRFNEEQTRALEDAGAAAARRFVELERAKAEVDRQVEARTAELSEATARLGESLRRLEQLARVKDEFIANVSHELRTPLTLILGPLEDLLAGAGPDARAEMEVMYRNALRLNGLVNDLLELARLQAGQLRLAVAEVDLPAVVAGAVERHRPLAERKGLVLTLHRDDDITICGDARRLEFAVANLLSNAIKFTPRGGAITVRVRRAEDGAAVEVADTGPGIPAEQHEEVFLRFTRFDRDGAPGAAGTGIGLALVKELVELHGGTVALASTAGAGAVFTLRLPRGDPAALARAAAAASDVPVPAAARPAPVAAVAPATEVAPSDSPPAGAPLVLLVEDNDDMRAFIRRVLTRRFRVTEAANAEEALAFLAGRRPDAVLSDVMMPGIDGHELCRRVKADPALRALPVILVTARHDASFAVQGFRSGADDYLVKPFGAEELLARVEVHVRLRQLLTESVHREKLAALGTIAAGLAHEVRNPLCAILASLPRVRRELEAADVAPGARAMLGVAIECAERIDRLIADVLTLGQPDREGPELIDPHVGLESALRLLAHRTPAAVQVRRRFEYTGRVLAESSSLNQVFVNLLDNALRAVGDRGAIEVATRPDEHGGASITVADSGPGVPPAIAARIFDPFFTTRPAGEGTGLGLHLSRQIVHNCGGELDLVTAPGWGACFRVRLRAQRRGET